MNLAATYFFDRALLDEQVAHNVRMAVDDTGTITSVAPDARPGAGDVRFAAALAGIPNAHSHAHQAAMAGRAEIRGEHDDSFWTWRDVMYRHALHMTPEQFEAVATALYVDLLKGGYTSVGEFHYLHHDCDGAPYASLALMGQRALAAAHRAGMAMTLLPVLYRFGDFGDAPAGRDQRRFVCDIDTYLELVADCATAAREVPHAVVGLAPHSLRAVSVDALREVLGASPLADDAPIHIHIAEQTAEVAASVAATGLRPVEYLAHSFALNDRWCLVHATHTSSAELDTIAKAAAVVALCPSTEANLGDGLFDAVGLRERDGRLAIGSDSNVVTDAADELRWLEYGQRLKHQKRNVLATRGGPGTGNQLLAAAQRGGAQALGQPVGRLAPGARADFLTLDPAAPGLVARGDQMFDAFVFGAGRRAVQHVFVGGRQVIEHGRHADDEAIAATARTALEALSP